MKRTNYKKYLFLLSFIFLLILTPTFFVEKMRAKIVALCAPLWKISSSFRSQNPLQEENLKLQTENQLLKNEVAKLNGALHELGQKTPPSPKSIVATVIFRDPATWSSALWVDVGEKTIEKNSPVLSGKSLIGVVDFVGKRHSRIRLLTDSALHPSVSPLSRKTEGCYLAKGVLQGAGEPLWRCKNNVLRGSGFKDEGSSIQVGDLLVTTGMDGVFPPNLKVATVTTIHPPKEGAFSYEIEAKPTCKDLNALKRVVIIPPLSRIEDEDCDSQ